MSRSQRASIRVLATATALGLLASAAVPAATAASQEGAANGITDLGPLMGGKANMQHAAFGVEGETNVAYLVSNRASGDSGNVVLSVIDYDKGALLRTRVLPGVTGVERVHVAKDGNVYMSALKTGGNALWQYSPTTSLVKEVATYLPYGRQITSDENSVVYVGAHGGRSKAQLISYNPATDKTEVLSLGEAPTARAAVHANGSVYASIDNGAERYIAQYDVETGDVTKLADTALTASVNTMAKFGNWLAVLDGSSIRFLNLVTHTWATNSDGTEHKIPGVFFGESEDRDGKIVVSSAGKFVVLDGSQSDRVVTTPTSIAFSANTIRGVKWSGTSGTDAFLTVQNSGHISHFDIATGKQTNVNPIQQHNSHPMGSLGKTSNGNLYSASTLSGAGVIFNSATAAVTSRDGLGQFSASTSVGALDYVVNGAGAVARITVEAGGAPEVIHAPAAGFKVVDLVAAGSELVILSSSGSDSAIHAYNPTSGAVREISGVPAGIQVTSGHTAGPLTYVSAHGASGAQLIAVNVADGSVVRSLPVTDSGAPVASLSGLSSPNGTDLWATAGDSVARIDASTGKLALKTSFAEALGSTDPSDLKETRWYGKTLFIGDEGGVASFDRSSSQVTQHISTNEMVTSWQLVSGADSAGLYFLSGANSANLRTSPVTFDPDAGGQDPGEVGPVVPTMPGVEFGEETSLGIPVAVASIVDMAFGELDGRKVGYTATSSDGSLLNVIDVEENKYIKSVLMPSVIQVWKLEIAPNGKVYVAAIGKNEEGQQRGELWIYDPATNAVEMAGVVPGASSSWSMVIDDDSNAYIGTYKTGEVVKYDQSTGSFQRFGQVEGQEYVRSIEYHDGYVYAGTGTKGSVVKIDVSDPTKRERISDPLLELFGVSELPWAYDMQKVGNWLLVNFTGDLSATAFYDLETGEWATNPLMKSTIPGTPTQNGNPGFTQLTPKGDKVYLTYNGTIAEVDLSGAQPSYKAMGVPFGLGMRGQTWADLSSLGHAGEWLVTASRQGPLRALNLETGQGISLPSVIQTDSGTPLHSINKNADGGLYFVTYPAGTGAEYNTKTGEFQRFPAEQAESMLTVGDATYFGVYPGGHIEKVVKDSTGRPQISKLFTIGEDQDRPYHMVESNGKLFIGSIPGYEKHQGALTIYDLETGEKTVEKGIVENQSVIGLAVRDNMVWGSTTVVGGLGADPIATEAKLFKYDAATGTKVGEYSLNLPGGQTPKHISALSFGPDGNLWGTTDGYVFVVNPDTMELVSEKTKNIYPEVTRYGMWRPMSYEWHEGLLYMNVASRLTVINPDTMEHRQLTPKGEEIARFAIADLAPGLVDETTGETTEGVPTETSNGLYFFGNAKSDTLRVIPMIEEVKTPVEPEKCRPGKGNGNAWGHDKGNGPNDNACKPGKGQGNGKGNGK
ncbi:hypothetical protein [Timonella senegalensis]|uniref:hypothetical protein n=1 Tax=Timonella senegalensis TaxID=1465825 RepID=UPI0028AF53D7|nr:hypothetical protein [Timonella senegalensis]